MSTSRLAAMTLAACLSLGAAPIGPDSPWKQLPGGPGTACALGTPFSFFVREGSPKRLLVILAGGGACWSSQTCVLGPVFDPSVEETDTPPATGIVDFTRGDNPLRDATVLAIPYCTGDAHLGDRDVTYTVPGDPGGAPREVRIHHGGIANVQDALAWAARNVPHPRLVVVLGFSAGAIASPYYAGRLAALYPHARVVQLGDSAGGYRTAAVTGILETWGATDHLRRESGYQDLDPATVVFEDLYTHAARATPRVRFGQVNSAGDATQLEFLALVGVRGLPLGGLLAQNLSRIRKDIPDLRTFTVPGEAHVLLDRPEFYSLRVQGVLLRDWVTRWIEGRPVESMGDDLLQP